MALSWPWSGSTFRTQNNMRPQRTKRLTTNRVVFIGSGGKCFATVVARIGRAGTRARQNRNGPVMGRSHVALLEGQLEGAEKLALHFGARRAAVGADSLSAVSQVGGNLLGPHNG